MRPSIIDIPVGIEEGTDVDSLTAPQVALDGPIEGQLQRSSVQRPGEKESASVRSYMVNQRVGVTGRP